MSGAFINYLLLLPGMVINVLMFYLLLGSKHKLYLPAHIALNAFIMLFHGVAADMPQTLYSIVSALCCILPPLIFCNGKFYKRALCTALVVLEFLVADYLTYMAILLIYPDTFLAPNDLPFSTQVISQLINLAIVTVFSYLILTLTPPVVNKVSSGILRKFAFFPLSQVFGLAPLYASILWSTASTPFVVFGIAAFAFCVVADIAMFFALRELNRKYVVERENAVLQSNLKAQISYYDQLTAEMERVNRMRHDFHNQLQVVYTLLESGDAALARENLDNISAALRRKSDFEKYSENPIVDAVLLDKARLCGENQIYLNVKAELPAQLPIEGVDICAVCSNLLDNAMNACAKLPDADERFIDFISGVRAGYLIVKVKNSAPDDAPASSKDEAAKKDSLLPEHGLGLHIVREIAGKYGGKLELDTGEGLFEATVWLPVD